mmetsp:Transcript_20382/g.63901  ORF Transcript_20382/g.63901 Transcript_20382/m.63901 type:complete len:274 (-) Transcript_20382:299-1120(-)
MALRRGPPPAGLPLPPAPSPPSTGRSQTCPARGRRPPSPAATSIREGPFRNPQLLVLPRKSHRARLSRGSQGNSMRPSRPGCAHETCSPVSHTRAARASCRRCPRPRRPRALPEGARHTAAPAPAARAPARRRPRGSVRQRPRRAPRCSRTWLKQGWRRWPPAAATATPARTGCWTALRRRPHHAPAWPGLVHVHVRRPHASWGEGGQPPSPAAGSPIPPVGGCQSALSARPRPASGWPGPASVRPRQVQPAARPAADSPAPPTGSCRNAPVP